MWQSIEARVEVKWRNVQGHLQTFFDDPKHRHLRVPQDYVTPDSYPLGQAVGHMRSRYDYINDHPEVANERDAKWEDLQGHLQNFTGSAGPPSPP